MRRRRHRGFTLIEVLAAFAVFAVCIGTFYELFGGAFIRSAQTRVRDRSLLVAQSILAQQRVRRAPWESTRTGHTPDGQHWQVTVTPFDAGTDENNRWKAYEVAVRVRSADATSTETLLRSIELVTSDP